MYAPKFNQWSSDDEIRAFVRDAGAGWVITSQPGEVPDATLLPLIWEEDRIIAHFAKANDHWRRIDDQQSVLIVVPGPDDYVSPRWYASKREHGRAVPTWNYIAVQLTGTATVHHDEAWLRRAVTMLSDLHEEAADEPWQVTDAPEAYVTGQLRGIVGLEIEVGSVTGKEKLSQNRSDADRRGVIEGLEAEGGDQRIAEAMRRAL